MNCHRLFRIASTGLLLLALAGASGCGGMAAREGREDRDPLLRRARERRTAQDIPGALAYYQRALDKKPTLARAHLELGAIYDQNERDYVRAVYHYERYLELQPAAEKKDLVQELIRHARLNFAASLPESSNESVRQVAILKQEVESLQREIARLREGARPAAAPSPAAARAPAAPAPEARAPAAAPPAAVVMDTYVVQSGDTMSRIAGRLYGDSQRWQEIYDANRAALPGGPQSIKVGQVLKVPRKSNR